MRHSRLEKISQLLREKKLDSLLIVNPPNIFYLTGSRAEGVVLLGPSYRFFVTSPLFMEEVRKNFTDFEVIISRKSLFIEAITETIRKLNVKRIGFENSYISLDKYERLKKLNRGVDFIPADDIIEDLRATKDEKEISCIKRAHFITLECFKHLRRYLRRGITERDLSTEAIYFIRKRADKEAFEPIVLFGERTSLPHGISTQRELKDNELILLDIGAKIEGYCADLTTVIFWGDISDKWQKIYNLLTQIQKEVIRVVKPGVVCSQIDGIVRKRLDEAGYLDVFIHNTGHGVGLEVHEKPVISRDSKDILKEGMVFTLEPGVYFPGEGGIRIEKMVIVDKTGGRFLNDYG